jgi:hypothetical protein
MSKVAEVAETLERTLTTVEAQLAETMTPEEHAAFVAKNALWGLAVRVGRAYLELDKVQSSRAAGDEPD